MPIDRSVVLSLGQIAVDICHVCTGTFLKRNTIELLTLRNENDSVVPATRVDRPFPRVHPLLLPLPVSSGDF